MGLHMLRKKGKTFDVLVEVESIGTGDIDLNSALRK
jgi:hypothetical protein